MSQTGKAYLKQEPSILKFGTSGLRAPATDLTDLECYINMLGFIDYLKNISAEDGGIKEGDEIYLAGDFRPSTPRIMKAIARAIKDSGCRVKNCGNISTPAVTYCGMRNHCASIMVTGSHIPEDRNGIKPNKTTGEVLKTDELAMSRYVFMAREKVYASLGPGCMFDENGMFAADEPLPEADSSQIEFYIKRYTDVFPANCLAGKKIVVYQHSSVGRDAVTEIFRRLGAEIIIEGRTDKFVSVDTEALKDEDIILMKQWAEKYHPFALISFDGDCDRPWLSNEKGEFLHGSLLGGLTTLYLRADAAAVPISCNDAVDEMLAGKTKLVKTKIGSPYVIKAMLDASKQGYKKLAGWEANGGFLTISDFELFGKNLSALPTRDCVLPMLCFILSAIEKNSTSSELMDALPKRYVSSSKIKEFPNDIADRITRRYTPEDDSIDKMEFLNGEIKLYRKDETAELIKEDMEFYKEWQEKKKTLDEKFLLPHGISRVSALVYTDGLRMLTENREVVHLRESNNAPEFRCYANADSQGRADELVRIVLGEVVPELSADVQ